MNAAVSIATLAIIASQQPSPPPTVTTLFPAGGTRGSAVSVTASGSFARWPVQVWASDPAVTGTATTTKGKFTLTVGAKATPGVCWLRLTEPTGVSQLRPFLVGVLPDAAEVEPNDAPDRPQSVTLPVVANGRLAKTGDVDCYAVRLTRGQTLVAAVEAHQLIRSPMDTVLQVVSPTGIVLQQNHDHRGLDPLVPFVAPADGTYVVRLFAYPSQPGSSIRHFGSELCVYRLTLTTSGFVDLATPFAIKHGAAGRLDLHGWCLPKTATLAAGQDWVVPAGAANVATTRREPHPCFDLTVKSSEQPLQPPFTATGRLAQPVTGQVVSFTGTKGTPLVVRVESESVGSPLVPVVRVTDAAGKSLATSEPPSLHADCEVTVTPPANGTYKVTVSDLYRDGGAKHFYRLRVVPAVPDFHPTVDSDRITVVAGKPFDLPVQLGRTHGFKAGLKWSIEGAPATVTVRPSPPTGKADPNTVVLRIEATKSGFSGPIRLVAETTDQPRVQRTVLVRLADFDTRVPHLWLTVTPAAR